MFVSTSVIYFDSLRRAGYIFFAAQVTYLPAVRGPRKCPRTLWCKDLESVQGPGGARTSKVSKLSNQTDAKYCDRLGARAKQDLRDFERRKTCETSVRPFDAIKIMLLLRHRQAIPRQKNPALLASLTGNQVMHPSVFAWQKTMPRCVIGRKTCHVLSCICQAGNLVREGTWLFKA